MTEDLKSAQEEMFKVGGASDTPTPSTETTDNNIQKETPAEENTEAPAEVVDKKEEKKVEKNWREKYKETDEYKESVRKKDLEAYEAKMREYQELENDPDWKLLKAARTANKSLPEYIKDFSTETVDKMTPEDLFKHDLEKYKEKLTEDEVEAEIDNFNNMSKLQQIKATDAIREQLKNERKEQMANFQPAAKKDIDPVLKDKAIKFESELDTALDRLEGQTIDGVKYTPTVLNKIEKALKSGLIPAHLYINDDGEFDLEEAIDLANYKVNRHLLFQGKEQKAQSAGMRAALKEKHNVSKAASGRMPGFSDSREELIAAQKSMFNQK